MIKKLLTASLLFSAFGALNAQEMIQAGEKIGTSSDLLQTMRSQNQNKSASVVPDGDTLFYFYNKHTYRNTPSQANLFYAINVPFSSTAVAISEYGSSFLNPGGATITVYGGYIMASRRSTSTSTAIPAMVYISSTGPNGTPPFAKLDSAMISSPITNTLGDFYVATFTTPVVVTGDYYLSYKPLPPVPQDTIRAFMTGAYTQTSSAAANLKFGEGLSFLKVNTNYQTTANLFNTGTPGSELEAIVAPIVSFNYNSTFTVMAPNAGTVSSTGYCANVPVSFTNTTHTSGPDTSIVENRQYNWNAFAPYWMPFSNTPTSTPVTEPIYNWSFSGAGGSGSFTTTNASATFTTAGTGQANLIVKYKHGSALGGKTQTVKTQTLEIVNCGIAGIKVNSANAELNVSVFPNPVVNGKATISGLEGLNTISVYNMIGQVILTEKTDKEVFTVDLGNQNQGTYLLRITDSSNRTKIVKVINQ